MMKFKNIFLGLCIAAASLNTFAQQSDEHKDHHPEKTAPSAVTIKQTVTSTTATDKMAAMDQHMKAMQAMCNGQVKSDTGIEITVFFCSKIFGDKYPNFECNRT